MIKKRVEKGIKETHTHKDDVLSSFLATLLHGWDCGTVGVWLSMKLEKRRGLELGSGTPFL